MFRFMLVSTLVAVAASYSHGGHYGGGGGGGGDHYGGHYGGHTVPAAVLSKHHVSYHDVHSVGHITPTNIDVPANILPINFVFRSASSHINVASKHEGAPGSHKETSSHDEPHKLVHTVYKPIYQEVKEVISPYRRIVQKVEPVKEEIQTIVARGHHGYHKGGGYEGGADMSYNGGGGSGEMAGYGGGEMMAGAYGGMAGGYGKY